MSTSIGLLNYFGLLLFYIVCFIFIFKNYTELIGFIILIVINIAALLYVSNDIMKILETSTFFVQMLGCLSIITGLILQTVVLIFVLMIANNLQTKFTKKNGMPFELPNKYRNKLEFIKQLMITSFCLGSIILYILFYYKNELNYDLVSIINSFKLRYLIEKKLLFFTLFASIALIVISSYEVNIGNSFLILSKQQLMDIPK